MNDPREETNIGPFLVEAFPVNDERALRTEMAELHADWDAVSDSERAAMTALVREALLRLADDVDVWLPAAVLAKSNTSFGFCVWWQNRHLDEEIVAQQVRAEQEDLDRLAELRQLAGRVHEVRGP